jgi:hypothetical protein
MKSTFYKGTWAYGFNTTKVFQLSGKRHVYQILVGKHKNVVITLEWFKYSIYESILKKKGVGGRHVPMLFRFKYAFKC